MMLTGNFIVVEINKKTTAGFFKDLKVGDKFTLAYNISGHYSQAPVIRIFVDDELVHSNNALQLKNNLSNFKIEHVESGLVF